MFKLVTPGEGAVLTPVASYEKNLVEVHKEKLYTKYQSSKLFSFREEEFRSYSLLCSSVQNCDLRGGASFDPEGHHMSKPGRGLKGDPLYQI